MSRKKKQQAKACKLNEYAAGKVTELLGECFEKICKEIDDEFYTREEEIISALQNGPLKKADIFEAVKHAFADVLTEEKQYKKLSNLLQQMKREGVVGVRGYAVHAEWFLVETN